MKPSTKVAAGLAAAVAASLAAMHFVLPSLNRRLSSAWTGSDGFESAHFRVHAPSPETAGAVAGVAEKFSEELVARWGTARGLRLPEDRITIYIFADREGLARHGLLKQGTALERNAGYFSSSELLIALVGADPEAVRHEVAHMICALSWPGAAVSPWLAEGLAQWHEAGAGGALPAPVAREVAAAHAAGTALPLSLVLDAGGADFLGEENRLFYFESAALYAWLAERHPEALAALLREERAPDAAADGALERALGMDLDAAEAEWRAWVAQKARG